MAHLEVEPKPSRPWWVWLLIVLLGILLAGLLLKKCSTEKEARTADTVAVDSGQVPLAKTTPDWNGVDFNSATQTLLALISRPEAVEPIPSIRLARISFSLLRAMTSRRMASKIATNQRRTEQPLSGRDHRCLWEYGFDRTCR